MTNAMQNNKDISLKYTLGPIYLFIEKTTCRFMSKTVDVTDMAVVEYACVDGL